MARSQISKIIEGNSAPESYRGEVNAFTIELLSMDERVNERCGKDYLEAAFEVFPDLDYCVMLLPTTDAFFPFLEHFVVIHVEKFLRGYISPTTWKVSTPPRAEGVG